jgi:CheY-like chemotaxis protein
MSAGPLVLIADDEDAVLSIAEAILTRSGYSIVVARDGVEALSQHQQHAGLVRAVLLDWTLPLLDGEGVLRELRRRDPNLPVIVSTGYGRPSAGLADIPGPEPLSLPKPYRLAELVGIVGKALGRA